MGDNMFPDFTLGTGHQYYEGVYDNDISEQFETLTETYATDGCSASVTLKCPWANRQALIHEMLRGGYGWDGTASTETHAGAMYPRVSNDDDMNMELQSVTVTPLKARYDTNGQVIEPEYALIQLQYATNKPIISYQNTSEYATINSAGLQWNITRDGTQTLYQISPEEAPGILMHGHILTIEAKRVNLSNFSLFGIEGRVNEKRIDFPNRFMVSYEPGTLMCNAPALKPHATVPYLYDITLQFAWREIGWNKFFHPLQDGSTVKEKAVSMCDSSGNEIQIFPTANFATLFSLVGIDAREGGTT